MLVKIPSMDNSYGICASEQHEILWPCLIAQGNKGSNKQHSILEKTSLNNLPSLGLEWSKKKKIKGNVYNIFIN